VLILVGLGFNAYSQAQNLRTSINEAIRIAGSESLDEQLLLERLELSLQQASALEQDIRRFTWVPRFGDSIKRVGTVLEGGILAAEILIPEMEAYLGEKDSLTDSSEILHQVVLRILAQRQDLYRAADLLATGIDDLDYVKEGEKQYVAEIAKGIRIVADLSFAAPEILGFHGVRKYLILGQTSDELRPTGGYISTTWVVTIKDGYLLNIEYKDVVEIDDWQNLNLYPLPAQAMRDHMRACCLLMRDVSWEPDFPSVARMAGQVYYLGQQEPLDGVLAINQWTVNSFMELLFPIVLPDGTIAHDGEQFEDFLLRKTDEEGRGYSEVILNSILKKAVDNFSDIDTAELLKFTLHALDTKLLLLYFDDYDAQNVISQLGWGGAMAESVDNDYLGVFDSNVGWNKVDRNIRRALAYEVILGQSENPPKASLSLEYANMSGPRASGCGYQFLPEIQGYANSELMHACYWNYLRVYLPHGSRLARSTPMPLPEGAVFATQGTGIVGADTRDVFAQYGKTGISGLITIPPGDKYVQEFLYELPDTVVRNSSHGRSRYGLTVQSQPGVLVRALSVTVRVPQGKIVTGFSPITGKLVGGTVSWSLDLVSDVEIEVEFE
jgi:hypothetical protein